MISKNRYYSYSKISEAKFRQLVRYFALDGLRTRFDKARILAAKNRPELSMAIQLFQFRDIRAKAATDKADTHGIRDAQMQLGHLNMSMTEHYVRKRRGQKVTPTR